ncbi:MAG: NAD-dependent epimerase/dehydratase family protein [Deltaproteobacteria bacterium]|nr:NAD-dependent epimerase/dehydratase family protein [Deltaproteobacteria bacterium]MBM4323653.1 NAD-dependent epimerase/dehydratase family protein [Deltaproteobacteria bacterium]
MKTILVTGGAGFIGSHLCERLLKEGHSVVCLDNFDSYYDPSIKIRNVEQISKKFPGLFTVVTGDIRNRDHLTEAFKKNRIHAVFHLAARAGVRPSIADPLLYEDVNLKGTVTLLEVCKAFDIKDFIFTSSSSVYGENQRVPFSETDLDIQPISPYGATKRAGELLCYSYHHLFGMNVACLRIFTAYGPRQRPEMAIHKFTSLMDQGKEITMFGDGSSKRDYTYIDDLIDGMMAVLQRHKGYEIYNLGESQTTSLKELIGMIESTLGKKAKIKVMENQPGDVSITYADISKARRLLNYQPKITMEEGIKRFVEWFKEQ